MAHLSLRVRTRAALTLGVVTILGCHDLTGTQPLPAGEHDPSFYNTASGALQMRNTAVFSFGLLLPREIVATGQLTDELISISTLFASPGNGVANGGAVTDPLDERILPEQSYGSVVTYQSDTVYSGLQSERALLLQAIGQLATYDTSAKDSLTLKPSAGKALRGELYALYGYTEIMLADLFCSGIPLSTLDFQHDFTYRAGSTTTQVYRDAIAHLDTAFALSADSARLRNLARVGLGRAYLDLGNTVAAADDVSGVPTTYQYQLSGIWGAACSGNVCNVVNQASTVVNGEGTNGLAYLSGDPRTRDTTISTYVLVSGAPRSATAGFPTLYTAGLAGTLYAPITIASGTEARLIEAEAALRAGNTANWLTTLNQLRATTVLPGGGGYVPPDTLWDTLGVTGCTAAQNCGADGVSGGTFQLPAGYNFAYAIQIQPVSSSLEDYCWNYSYYEPCYDGVVDTIKVYVSAAKSSTLTPLTDPGSDSARVALTFRERAFWLYLTGHRQGDLRRQLRNYPQYWPDQSAVYPTGTYLGLGAGLYGSDVTAPIPANEYINPLFHGCLNRAP